MAFLALVIGAVLTATPIALATTGLEFDLEISLSGMAPQSIAGAMEVHEDKFQGHFHKGDVRLSLWGTLTDDQISIGGTPKTNYINAPALVSVDGQMVNGEFTKKFRTRGGVHDDYRCLIVVRQTSE